MYILKYSSLFFQLNNYSFFLSPLFTPYSTFYHFPFCIQSSPSQSISAIFFLLKSISNIWLSIALSINFPSIIYRLYSSIKIAILYYFQSVVKPPSACYLLAYLFPCSFPPFIFPIAVCKFALCSDYFPVNF